MAENKIKTIGVLTSGGDAPGMNAANPCCCQKRIKQRTERKGKSIKDTAVS